MNRFPIWKGKRIGRYDDRLILRSVIFFALIITALSVFMIRLTEGACEKTRVFSFLLLLIVIIIAILHKKGYSSPYPIRMIL